MSKFIKNFFSLTTANLFSRVAGLIYLPYIARVFGPDGMGKVNFAESISGFFLLASHLGLDLIGTREIAKFKDKQNAFIHILIIEIVTSFVSFFALCAFVYFINKPPEVKMLIILYGFSILTFAFTIDWFFMGLEQMGTLAIVGTVRQLLYIGLVLLTVHLPEHVYRLPLSIVAADIIQIAILFALFFMKTKLPDFKVSLSTIRYLFNEAISLGISGFLNSSRERVGPVVLGFLRSSTEVGFYGASFKLLCVANIVPYMLYKAIFPDMSYYLRNKSDKETLLYIKRIINLISVIAFPFCFLVYYNAPFLVYSIFGQDFGNAIYVLQIMIWSTGVYLFNRVYYFHVVATGAQHKLFICTLSGLIINIALCFVFVRMRGDLGAAAAFLISEVLLSFFYYIASGVRAIPAKEFLKSFICFLPSAVLCLILKNRLHSITVSILAAALYAAIIFVAYDVKLLLKLHVREAESSAENKILNELL